MDLRFQNKEAGGDRGGCGNMLSAKSQCIHVLE